jgi:hypothetical protein
MGSRTQMNIDALLKTETLKPEQHEYIKEAVKSYTYEATQDIITESARRYRDLRKIFDCLHRLRIPFGTDDLKKRFTEKHIDLNEAMTVLWEVGLLGVVITCHRPESVEKFKKLLQGNSYRRDLNLKNIQMHRWFFFEYNYDGAFNELLNTFLNHDKEDSIHSAFVLHPRTFEFLGADVDADWPIGI